MPLPSWRFAARLLRRIGRPRHRRLPQWESVEPRRLLSSTVIFADGFEGTGSTFPGWTLHTHSGGSASPKWGPSDVQVFAGARSAYSGGPGRSAYTEDQHTGLVREHVSLAGYGSASLSFKYYLNTEAGYDFFRVDVIDSGPGGSTRTLFRDSGDDRAAGWQAKTIDLSAYAGRTDLGIEFRFDSDHSVSRAAPSGVWIDDVRLTADTKTSTGTIKGTLFDDGNGDRTRDAGEGPLAGWTVYLDRNQNRRRDSNEPWRTTDSSGRYTFSGLAPGTYYVASEGRPGYVQTSPTPADVRLGAGNFDITLHFADSSIDSTVRKAFEAAARRWEQLIVGDLPDVQDEGQTIDDVVIDADFTELDGSGGVLAQSSPTATRDGAGGRGRPGLPYRGFVEVDAADLAQLKRSGTLTAVITHEMAHALGFGTLWEDSGLLKSGGTNDPRFVGPVAVAQYDAIFGTSARSVPVEGEGGPGTRDSHWAERAFGRELMTGFVDMPPLPVSRVTVGAMADLGYVVDLSAADDFVPPGGRPVGQAGGAERPVTVTAGKTKSGIDFGHRRSNQPPSVATLAVVPSSSTAGAAIKLTAGGVVDRDGSIAKVGFYRESNGETGLQFGSGGDTLVATDSSSSGGYSVTVSTTGLAPGTYTYYAVAVDDKGASSPGGGAAPRGTHMVQAAGRIRGTVFRDDDADGARDAGEAALAGARVYLDANGNDRFDSGEASVISDAGGAYAFEGLAADSYTVRCLPPDGFFRTAPMTGKYAVTLGAGESVTLRSFGAAPAARITGRVFDDADGDGAKDSTEAGVAGWRVFADANNNGKLDAGESSALTGSNGTYTLLGLRPGTYSVRVQLLSGWRITSPAAGRYDGVLVAVAQTLSGKNFGVARTA